MPAVWLGDVPNLIRANREDESTRLMFETKAIKKMIASYFNSTKYRFFDLILKTTMTCLVNESKKLAKKELIEMVFRDNVTLEALIAEDPMTKSKIESCKKTISALKMA